MTQEIDITHLSPAECIVLAEQLWEKARNHPEALPITSAQQAELERRLAAMERGEVTYSSWEDVKRRLLRLE